MAYSTQTIIETIYGATNVAEWADMDNDEGAVDIAARIARAIVVADAEIDDRLRATCYQLPLANVSAVTPPLIAEISGVLAGLWLYESRGAIDVGDDGKPIHSHSFRRTWAYETLRMIVSREIELDAVIGI